MLVLLLPPPVEVPSVSPPVLLLEPPVEDVSGKSVVPTPYAGSGPGPLLTVPDMSEPVLLIVGSVDPLEP